MDIRDYHDRTKHRFNQYARSKGYLDWETQPEAFREFDGAAKVALGFEGGEPIAWDELFAAGAREAAPMTADFIGDLLLHSLAISAWKQAGPSRWALRINPSSGNLHPTEGYAILPAVEGISDAPGVYHYLPRDHVLEHRAGLTEGAFAELTTGLPAGSFLLGLTSITWREAWKYGERAFRYCQHDTGHAIAALRLAAALRGWHLTALGWSHDVVDALLGLDRAEDFPVTEEREEAELILAVTPAPLASPPGAPDPAVLRDIRAAPWTGIANELSPDHDDWPIIEEAARASRNPGHAFGPAPDLPDRPAHPGDRPAHDARALFRQRRSAVSFDGGSSISTDGFLRILARTLPGRHPPFDALGFPPAIHLALFVHRVEGLTPGLYFLCRDPGALGRLKTALRPDAKWERPPGVPEDFPLHLIATGDCRAVAAQLSCGQDIAGASFFSLGMIADFEATLAAHGPWFYRNPFWESGVVGQMLYLEAEAEGARGTGIGCYFDDGVHELLGLAGRAFQSLYHFTIGIPVEDTRLTTLPPYPGR